MGYKEQKELKKKIIKSRDDIFAAKQRSYDLNSELKTLIKINCSSEQIKRVTNELEETIKKIKKLENKLIDYTEKLELHEKFNR